MSDLIFHTPNNASLRKKIIAAMKAYEEEQEKAHSYYVREAYATYPTWWFKSSIDCTTVEARKELKRMEAEGLVTADRKQKNNTLWLLAGKTHA